MVNGYVIKLLGTLEIKETLDFVCLDLLLIITPLMLMLLLHSKIFLVPNQSYFLSIQLTMVSERTCFLIPFILLRTSQIIKCQKVVFPEFSYNQGNIQLPCLQSYINWADLYNIYDKDKKLKGNLRKAPKLSYQTLHPGNNKQNVPLALALFHDTTIAATKSFYPNREDVSGFLNVIHTWWTISTSKQRDSANPLGNAIVLNDSKTNVFRLLAFWIQEVKNGLFHLISP